MRKKLSALILFLTLCLSLFPSSLAAGMSYKEAVAQFHSKSSVLEITDTFESDYGTIFVYQIPSPHGNAGSMVFITKAPCAKGEGETVELPYPRHGVMNMIRPAASMELSPDGKSFTYTYHFDEPLSSNQAPMLRPAGDFLYTLDLTTGEVASQIPSIPKDYNTYAAAMERIKSEEGWTIEQTLEAPACTVLLRYFQTGDGRRSYFLDFVYKMENAFYGEGVISSHDLTVTRDDGTGEPGFPVLYTHRAPDTLTLNEDKTLLTYSYSESLEGGPDTGTLELSTGFSVRSNTLPTMEPTEPQPPTPTEFTDVPAGSWFERGIQTCAEKGIMVGTGEGTFSPEAKLSQAECLTLAFRLYDLMRGQEHVIEKAPEAEGKMTLTLADGTIFEGYGVGTDGEAAVFHWWVSHLGDREAAYTIVPGWSGEDIKADAKAQQAWLAAHPEVRGHGVPATMTLNGVTYQGTTDCWMPVMPLVFQFNPEPEKTEEVNSILHDAVYRKAPPNYWWRDTVYTIEKREMAGIFSPAEFSDSPASRGFFARLIAAACEGHLEKFNTVEAIPDLPREKDNTSADAYREAAYALYEAGILTGTDPAGTFAADHTLTRAEAAVMVARVLDEAQRITTPPTTGSAYDQAVAELRSGMGHSNEQIFDTDLCTIFVFDRGGFMRAPAGAIRIIYKAGSPLGDGYVLDPPNVRNDFRITPADTMTLDVEKQSFTYSYFYETSAWDSSIQSYDTRVEPGTFTFTVDLATGEVHREYRPVDYAGAMAHVTRRRIATSIEHSDDREVARTLEAPDCTVVLTKGRYLDRYDDYILSLVYKPDSALGEGTIKRLLLPSTVYAKGYSYHPTDRSPDILELSGDGKALTYIYHFDEALEYFHEAGTYTYTVDLATGELSVEHTADG